MPGLPPGFRWEISKPWFSGYHWIELQKLNKRNRWKVVRQSKVAVYSWGEPRRPSPDAFEATAREVAESTLRSYKGRQKMKELSQDWVGVYESRKVPAVSERVRRQDNDR